MNYHIAIDPQLGLSADEFVQAWNAGEDVPASSAAVDTSNTVSFLPLEVTVALITAAVSIPATIVADFVTEYLKKKYIEKEAPKVTVTTIAMPDGQPVFIIKKEQK